MKAGKNVAWVVYLLLQGRSGEGIRNNPGYFLPFEIEAN
jgi:hypothetical protein